MDSEEEYEELNGEDINSENTKEEEDENDVEEDETPGWIVPDGYLSDEEKKLGREEEDVDDVAKVKTTGIQRQRPSHYVTSTLKPKILLQQELNEEMLQFTIQILPN